MQGNKKSLLVVALLLLVGVTSAYVAYSYAKYTSKIEGNQGTVQVAKWAFASDNTANSNLTINIATTAHASTLVSGKIAPGTTGSFAIHLSNENTEVGVDFTVALKSVANKPTNLKFYKDNTYTTELTPGTSTITGQLIANDSTGIDVPVYWRWEYETNAIATNDPIDTEDGEAANSLTIGVDITGTQVAPNATAITTHIN